MKIKEINREYLKENWFEICSVTDAMLPPELTSFFAVEELYVAVGMLKHNQKKFWDSLNDDPLYRKDDGEFEIKTYFEFVEKHPEHKDFVIFEE